MLRTLEIHGEGGDSIILIGARLGELKGLVSGNKVAIITDTNVRHHYIGKFPPWEVIEIGVGEKHKTLDTVRYIYGRLSELELDRFSFIVGIGGGMVCDVAGFAASTYLRGIRFGFVPSTLLAQVDAGVGGKTGVNFDGYKNVVGLFSQPDFVLCDTEFLKTLPHKEILCGLAEVVKHAAIGDPVLFSYLEEHCRNMFKPASWVMEKIVHDSLLIKLAVVNRDEREEGERRKLNFGHTLGHAIEKATGASHGDAVSVGMVAASLLSENKGYLSREDRERIENLLRKLRLPTRFRFNRKEVLEALRKDKKRYGEGVDFVFLEGIGRAVVEKITFEELEHAVERVVA